MILQCGVLKVMDYFHCVMHNSPAADDFAMWSVKSYGLFSLCDAFLQAADDFAMWSVKCYGLFSLCDA